MATLPFFAVALLALCMVIPTALSLQCYECSSHPQFIGGTSCSSDNVTKITCHPINDRCMTIKYTLSLGIGAPQSLELRNCSNSLACDPQSDFNTCKLINITGLFSNCTLDCCQGDLCNMKSSTSMPTTSAVSSTVTPSVLQSTSPKPTGAVLGLAANLGAILSTLVLSKFVGIN